MSSSLWSQARAFVRRRARFYARGLRPAPRLSTLAKVRRWRDQFETLTDDELRALNPGSRVEAFGQAAAAIERLLGLRPHDVQILGALAMAEGSITEMQTGEGKTLAAVVAVYDLTTRFMYLPPTITWRSAMRSGWARCTGSWGFPWATSTRA